jgi:small subunit ribosomal protein S3
MRVGVNKNWQSAWYANKSNYADTLIDDIEIREFLNSELQSAGLDDLIIKRYTNKLEISIYVARPGIVIGRGGSGIEELKSRLQKKYGGNIELKVFEVKRPEIAAKIVASNIAYQLEKRVVPKYVAKRALEAAEQTNEIQGIRIWISGRIKGAEIARTEKFQFGTVPLSTLRADIDYAFTNAQVPNAGKHGIKVWIYKGEKNNYELHE